METVHSNKTQFSQAIYITLILQANHAHASMITHTHTHNKVGRPVPSDIVYIHPFTDRLTTS